MCLLSTQFCNVIFNNLIFKQISLVLDNVFNMNIFSLKFCFRDKEFISLQCTISKISILCLTVLFFHYLYTAANFTIHHLTSQWNVMCCGCSRLYFINLFYFFFLLFEFYLFHSDTPFILLFITHSCNDLHNLISVRLSTVMPLSININAVYGERELLPLVKTLIKSAGKHRKQSQTLIEKKN